MMRTWKTKRPCVYQTNSAPEPCEELWIFKLPDISLLILIMFVHVFPFFGFGSAGRCHFDHRRGDLFTTLRVYQSWLRERSRSEGGSDSRSRRWCREHGLDERLLFEVNKMHGLKWCKLAEKVKQKLFGAAAGVSFSWGGGCCFLRRTWRIW